MKVFIDVSRGRNGAEDEGFTLTEFLICALTILLAASAAFGVLSEIQRTASHQAEVQSVLNNTRVAMQAVERYIRQAGNDPFACGLSAVTIVNGTAVQLRSDVTGSDASNPDKGDPDGDANDSGENVTIRFNERSRSIEIVPDGGSPQIIANYISNLAFQYYDLEGAETESSRKVRRIVVSISGSSPFPNPQTGRPFGVTLRSEILIAT